MSQNRKLTSLVSCVALIGVAGSLAVACGGGDDGDGNGGGCGTVSARVQALQDSSAALTSVAAGIKADVLGACAQLAGMTAPAAAAATDNDVTTICNAAKLRLDAAIDAGITITVVPPVCTVDAQAQFDCEAGCQAEANLECTEPEINVRCEPGELSVQCMGTCNVDAYCEGTLEAKVACEAKCEGQCTGTCSGKCSGTCEGTCMGTNTNGRCEGTCMGTCTGECDANCTGQCGGSCQVKTMGGVNCGANARCRGGCTGTAMAPRCEGTLKPAMCTGDANVDCSADCEGSASLKAQCSDPKIVIAGQVEANVKTAIEAAVPKLLKVTAQGELAVDAVGDIVGKMNAVAGQVGGCVLEVGAAAAGFAAAAQATATASASVSVSFSASASVSGSAAGAS
jgi:hypothetical protein